MLARDTATGNALDKTPGWIRELGALVYTRHVKSQDENPWRLRIRGADPATYAAAASDEAGLAMIGYYTTEFDAETAAVHPEWICRQPDGRPNDLAYAGALGTALDITTPYGDLVARDLVRVIESGVKGIYLDRMLIPPGGDGSEYSIQEFQAETGRPYPLLMPAVASDISYWFRRTRYTDDEILWYQWKAQRVARTLENWRNAIRAVDPEAVLVASMTTLPAFIRPDSTTAWCRIADVAKVEVGTATARIARNSLDIAHPEIETAADDDATAFGWALVRDASDGRPFHCWSGLGFPSSSEVLSWATAVLTYGGVANLDLDEYSQIPGRARSVSTSPEAAGEVFRLGRAVSPYLRHTAPLPMACIHASATTRDRLLTSEDGVGVVARQLALPSIATFGTLTRLGVPVGILDDAHLTNGVPDSAQLLVLPHYGPLSPSHEQAVSAFRARGGRVLEEADLPDWSQGVAEGELQLARIVSSLAPRFPVRMHAPGGRCHIGAFRLLGEPRAPLSRLVVTLSQPWRAVGSAAPGSQEPVEGIEVEVEHDLLRNDANARAMEMISGDALEVERVGSRLRIMVPDFDLLACVVVW